MGKGQIIMIYGQCNKCNERWELGTARTCKCLELNKPTSAEYAMGYAEGFNDACQQNPSARRQAFKEIADKIQIMPFTDATIDSFIIWLKEQE